MATAKYKRVLLKLSGEAFGGEKEYGIDAVVLTRRGPANQTGDGDGS